MFAFRCWLIQAQIVADFIVFLFQMKLISLLCRLRMVENNRKVELHQQKKNTYIYLKQYRMYEARLFEMMSNAQLILACAWVPNTILPL